MCFPEVRQQEDDNQILFLFPSLSLSLSLVIIIQSTCPSVHQLPVPKNLVNSEFPQAQFGFRWYMSRAQHLSA